MKLYNHDITAGRRGDTCRLENGKAYETVRKYTAVIITMYKHIARINMCFIGCLPKTCYEAKLQPLQLR